MKDVLLLHHGKRGIQGKSRGNNESGVEIILLNKKSVNITFGFSTGIILCNNPKMQLA